MIHLQGMGVIGSLLAHTLREQRIKFTWSDTEEQNTAWQACTGAVYPTGDEWEQENYLRWMNGFLANSITLQRNTEQALWCFNAKSPPHKAELRIRDTVGPIAISDGVSLQFNMQQIVKDTRIKFEARRVDAPDRRDTVIVTHGTAQADRHVWGWSCLVRLEFATELLEALAYQSERRPTFYLRQVYDMSYLYPYPGRQDLWYGGTSTITQRVPKSLDAVAHYKRWKQKVSERSGGLVEVAGGLKSSLVEGWRPKSTEELPLVRTDGDSHGRTLLLRPMGGNGVRFFPALAEAVLEQIA